MDVFLAGSSVLTKYDKEEINQYLKTYVPKNTIHLLCYRSLETEVLKFFIENDEYASKLHIYTLQPFDNSTSLLKESILYLKSKGSLYHSFNHEGVEVRRAFYQQAWKEMLKSIDLVVCFYNGDKPSALIPVDIAKEVGVDGMIFDLPGYQKEKRNRKIKDKVRVV